jgi:hypothetical protein
MRRLSRGIRMKLWKRWLGGLCVAAWAWASAAQAEVPKKLTEPQAYQILRKAYGNLHGGVFEYGPDMDKVFYAYQGIGPAGTEGSFGFFAVNPWTGDVWALWGCHKLKTPRLRPLKAEVRRRFTSEELKQYRRLSGLKPECVFEG